MCVCCCVSGSWSDLNSHISWGSGKPTSFSLSIRLSFSLAILPSLFFPSLILFGSSHFMTHREKTCKHAFRDSRNSCSAAESWVCLRNSIRLRGNLELLCWNTGYFPPSDCRSFTCRWVETVTWEVWRWHRRTKEASRNKKKRKEVSLSPKTFYGMSLSHRAEGWNWLLYTLIHDWRRKLLWF